ncbi:hypothetical protein HKD37_18G051457 [Glycine soja]
MLAQTWSAFSYSNLTPTSHTSDLNMDRARLVYGLVMKMDMDGVVPDSLTFESLSLAINLAYIRKNCWNSDDPTITFSGTRKARARGPDISARSSSAPTVPALAPALAPLAPIPAPSSTSTQSTEILVPML